MKKFRLINLLILVFLSSSVYAEEDFKNGFATVFYRDIILIEISDVKLYNKKIFLKLDALMQAIYLNQNYQVRNDRIGGFFDDENLKFNITLDALDPNGDPYFFQDDNKRLYASLVFLNAYSNLNITGTTSTLDVSLRPEKTLAFERFNNLLKDPAVLRNKKNQTKLAESAEYYFLSRPRLQLSNRLYKREDQHFSSQSTLSSDFDLLWTNTQLNITKAIDTDPSYFYRMSRVLTGNEMNDFYISEFQLGDVSSPLIPYSNSRFGSGIYLSSSHQGWMSNTQVATIDGTTEPNAFLEIYINDMLYDTLQSDATGFYTLNVSGLYIGSNEIKVIRTDNYGSEVILQQDYINSGNILKSGGLEYAFSYIDIENRTIEHENQYNPRDFVSSYLVRYGLFKDLSLYYGTNRGDDFENVAGFNFRLFSFYQEVALQENYKLDAWIYNLTGRSFGFLNYNIYYRDILYLASGDSNLQDDQRGYEKVLDAAIIGIPFASVNVKYTEALEKYDVEKEELQSQINFYINLVKLRFSHIYNFQDEIQSLIAKAYTRMNKLLIESEISFNRLSEQTTLQRYDIRTIWKPDEDSAYFVDFKAIPEKNKTIKLGFKSTFWGIDYELYTGRDFDNTLGDNHNFIGLNSLVKFIPVSGGYTMVDTYNFSRGTMDVIAFIDENNNDIYDENEAVLEDIRFRLSHLNEIFITDETGRSTIVGLMDNRVNSIYIDSLKENIAYRPKVTRKDFTGRNTYMGEFYFPFIKSVYVDGFLLIIDANGENKQIAADSIFLLNLDTNQKIIPNIVQGGYFFVNAEDFGQYRMGADNCISDEITIDWSESGYVGLDEVKLVCE